MKSAAEQPGDTNMMPRPVIQTPRRPRILLAASGSVAAIKFGNLCVGFSEWAEVKAVVTLAALNFVDRSSIPNDIMVIAPLSANTLAKIAGGHCDNLLTCIIRAWHYTKPIFIAPAMNTFMWTNPFTEKHLMTVDELGMTLIPPVHNRLACGDYGNGAMAEPSHVNSTVHMFLEARAGHSDAE